MTRTPLRPLARILSARARGENPDAIERENIRIRREAVRDRARVRAEGRLLLLGAAFLTAFGVIGVQMGALAASEPAEPRHAAAGETIATQRADILDRQGRVLATNLVTHALYAQPQFMVDPVRAADALAAIFPDLDAGRLKADFTGKRKFLWIKRKISPEQMQRVHEIGDPGLMFGPREMRLYPNGTLAAHVLGGAGFGREGVGSAEVIGTAGVEKAFDGYLRDPANGGAPLRLTLDLTVQAAVEEVLAGGMRLMNAKAAAAILMDAHSGEIVALASLPDFDPNSRPLAPVKGDAGDSPLFNRAVQGVYELGSTFKIFAIAQALDLGLVRPETMIDTRGPMVWGKFRIRDFHDYGRELSVRDVIVKSSNIGTARVAQRIGGPRQQDFLRRLGFFAPTPIELVEAPGARPLVPAKWPEITTLTVAFGHGIAVSPLHLAAAYAAMVNGGTRVMPTIVQRQPAADASADGAAAPAKPAATTAAITAAALIRPETSAIIRGMLREVVQRGTASLGEVPGYAVGGKTGTADKPKPSGGYYKDKVVATFAAVFPADDPAYVLIVTLDEPVDTSGTKPRRTAGWTAVPVGAEIIRRAAPLLGLRPEVEPLADAGVIRVRN